MARTWRILATARYRIWRGQLDAQEQDAITAAIEHLKSDGPALRRPLSGQVKSSHWAGWYRRNVPIADEIYRQLLAERPGNPEAGTRRGRKR